MCRVKAKIKEGQVAHERLAYIQLAEGITAEVIVSRLHAGIADVQAFEIRQEGSRVLVELPSETSTGDWRVWVPETTVIRA